MSNYVLVLNQLEISLNNDDIIEMDDSDKETILVQKNLIPPDSIGTNSYKIYLINKPYLKEHFDKDFQNNIKQIWKYSSDLTTLQEIEPLPNIQNITKVSELVNIKIVKSKDNSKYSYIIGIDHHPFMDKNLLNK